MYRVYGDIFSGNCYKVKLLMSLLGIDHEWVHLDLLSGESRSREFQAMNPVGKVPVMALPGGGYLWESNAILNYLATGTDYLPSAPLGRARVLQWQFFEQYNHEPGVAVARFISKYLGLPDERRADFAAAQAKGVAALEVMEQHLADHRYFVEDAYTIADISLYAYTHVAEEGEFDMSPYRHIREWLARVAAHPRHVTMDEFDESRNR